MANSSYSSGIGFHGLLAILFIALKLTGIITWSWLWVLSPLWISLAIGMVFCSALLVWLAMKEGQNG